MQRRSIASYGTAPVDERMMAQRMVRNSRTPLAVALLASGVIHFLVLMTPLMPVDRPARGPRQESSLVSPSGLRVIPISVLALRAGRPVLEARPTLPAAVSTNESTIAPPVPSSSAEVSIGARDLGSVLTRASILPAATAPSAIERVSARITAELRPFNDSLVEVESRGKPTDWSTTDGNGKRWGVSPGKVHVAGRSFSPCKVLLDPVSCQYRIADTERRESRERRELHREIQLQAARIEIDQQLRARVKAMEVRKAAARDTSRGAR